MSKFCHQGCEMRSCMGDTREGLIEKIMDKHFLLQSAFLESLSDDELDEMAGDLSYEETPLGHLKRTK